MTVSIRASLVLSALAMVALTAAFADPRETPEAAKPADNKLHAQEALPSLVELASSSISEDASRRAGERGGQLKTQETLHQTTGPAPSSPAEPPARSAP